MKNDFRYRLLSFMQGRYGYDLMSRDLTILGLVITLAAQIFNIPYIYYLGLALWIYSIYRSYSRNIVKRQQEFAKYCRFKNSLRSAFSFKKKSGNRAGGSYSNADSSYSYYRSDAYKDMPKKSYKEKRAAKKARKADKDHIYFRCDGCGLEMRVPKGVGKIEASCPRCRVKTTIDTNK